MSLSQKHLKDICLIGSMDRSKTCRYLKQDELDDSKWYCQKLQPSERVKIDVTVEAFMRRTSPIAFIPVGDNCEGYPVLRNLVQGYDVD